MSVKQYNYNVQITQHFNSSEFKCPHCGKIKIDNELINKVEHIFNKLNAKKCLVSSGYRCSTYDIKENGFAGKHSEGLAMDCIFYDKNNNIIPSSIVICIAYDIGELKGIARINQNYVHLDNREGTFYKGDEVRGNSSYWENPYKYFNVTKNDVQKYIRDNFIKYQSHGLDEKWYPDVINNCADYAGVYGIAMDGIQIDNLKYRVKVNGIWLPEVTGRNDYGGILGKPITDIAISGNVKYRVHIKEQRDLNNNIIVNGKWLPFVDGYDINDYNNGYAGNGNIIDAFQIK